jgi:hypothetical protein
MFNITLTAEQLRVVRQMLQFAAERAQDHVDVVCKEDGIWPSQADDDTYGPRLDYQAMVAAEICKLFE